jgi:hypothetical protein
VRNRLGERDRDDFGLRCLIETMHREGADERAIVRAMQHAVRSDDPRRGPGAVQRLWHFVTRAGRR